MNILFVLNGHKFVSYFYEPLAQYANSLGSEVDLVLPKFGKFNDSQWPLSSNKPSKIELVRNPFNLIGFLVEIFQRSFIPQKTDILHVVTTHMIFLCILRIAIRVEKFNGLFLMQFIGLGRYFGTKGVFPFVLKFFFKLIWKYRKKENVAYKCVYLNDEDLTFLKSIFGEKNIKYLKVPGAGVRLDQFEFNYVPIDQPLKLLFLGRLIKEKGIEKFLYLVDDLNNHTKFQVSCDIVGEFEDSAYKKKIMNLIQDLELKKVIRLIGGVEKPSKFYEAAHFFIFPSYYGEGVPTVLNESQYCGTPCLASDIAGCREAIENKVTGYLVPSDQRNDWFNKFKEMAESKNYEKMCYAAHERVKEKFDAKKLAKRTIDWTIKEFEEFLVR